MIHLARSGRPARRSLVSTLCFLACTTPLGIIVHLVAELAGLGWHDGVNVVLSARHEYFGLLALVVLGALICAIRSIPRSDHQACITWIVDGLPFHGRGAGFAATSFAAQFAFFGVTQLGEGSPLSSGDVAAGILAAALAAAVGAVAITMCKRRLVSLTLALFWYVVREHARVGCYAARRRKGRAVASRRLPFSFRYRPPPRLLALNLS